MKKLFFIALLALIAFGCRSVKQTSVTKVEAKTSANMDIKQSADVQSKVDSSRTIVDKSVTNSVVNEVITITDLSKPDSLGKQYPVKTTVINRTSDNKKAADVKQSTVSSNQLAVKAKMADKSDYKSEIKAKTDDKKIEETKTPAWVYVAVFVLVLALIWFVYLALKRFGIIK